MEQILPLLKTLANNFEYPLVFIVFIIYFLAHKYKKSLLARKINAFVEFINSRFNQLANINAKKLLFIFFLTNFAGHFLMALPVPEISSFDKISPEYLNLARSLAQGEGLTSHVVWNNFLAPATISRPDFFRFPLYPLLIALFYQIFGFSFLAAKLVNVLFGALLPILAYLAAKQLTGSPKVSLLALLLVSANQLLLSWSTMTYPEIVYGCGGILFVYFLIKTFDKNKSLDQNQTPPAFNQKINFILMPLLVGLFWALSYLTRSEALYIFLPVIIFYYFYRCSLKTGLIKTFLALLGFLIIAWPHLARNYLITGNLFYTDFPQVALVSYVEHDFLIESPESDFRNIFDAFLKRPWFVIARFLKYMFAGLVDFPDMLLQSYLLFIFSLIGYYYLFKERRHIALALLVLFVAGFALPGIVSVTDRYYIILIVLLVILASLGIARVWQNKLENKPLIKNALITYLLLFIILGGVKGIINGSIALMPHNFYARFDEKRHFQNVLDIYDFIKNNSAASDTVMASRRPYEVYYFTGHPTIIFPFSDEAGVQKFMKKYQVKWIVRMGIPAEVGDKFAVFWPDHKIPKNIKEVFRNSAGQVYLVEYYQ